MHADDGPDLGPGGVATALAERLGDAYQATPLEPPPLPFVPGELIRAVITSQRLVTLTFDDGPWPYNTRAVMNILRGRGYEGLATFFQLGNNVLSYPDISREVAARGYTIGNHSLTHTTYIASRIAAEIPLAQDLIEQVTGIRPIYFRSPGLTEGDSIQQACAAQGMCNVFTDRDLRDWVTPRLSASTLVARFASQLHPGLINLAHDGGSHRNTVDALHGIIDVIELRGYRLVSLTDLLLAGPHTAGGIAGAVVGSGDPEGFFGDTADGVFSEGEVPS